MSRIDKLKIGNTEYELGVNRINNLQTTINSLQSTINSLTNRISSLEGGHSTGNIQLTLYEKNNNDYYIDVQTTYISNRNNIRYYTMLGDRNDHAEQDITTYVNYVSGSNNNFRIRVNTARLSSDDFGDFGWYDDPTLVNRWNIRAKAIDYYGNDISYTLFMDEVRQIINYTVTFDGFDGDATSMTVAEGTEITLPTSAYKNDTDQFTYTFTGWKNNSTNTTYSGGSKVTINANTTFTAQFQSNTRSYLVTFKITSGKIISGNGILSSQYEAQTYVYYGQTTSWTIEPSASDGYSLPTNSTCDNCTINGNKVTCDPVYGSFTCTADCIEENIDTSYAYIGYFDVNGHPYVDLDLPSGTLWARKNVGANTIYDYGNYYMYGKGSRTYNSNDTYYTGTENPLSLTKDTANAVFSGDWHMPTKAQIQELIANTTYKWKTNYNGSGINGGLFTSKTNGQTLFLPACGLYSGSSNRYYVGSYGYYWSSSPHVDNGNAWNFDVLNNSSPEINGTSRSDGFCVRGVVG